MLSALQKRTRQAIRDAELRFGRQPGSVGLLAVSKTRSATELRHAMQGGQCDFGENYLQEALGKIAELQRPSIPAAESATSTGTQCRPIWHFIGAIQSNKTRQIARHFDWVHTVDREKIAERLSAARPPGAPELNVCIQFNPSAKHTDRPGVGPKRLPELLRHMDGLPGLRLRGLMVFPPPEESFAAQCRVFSQARQLFEELATAPKTSAGAWDTLSMGTSHDLLAAIACGSTLVRVGTGFFGTRG